MNYKTASLQLGLDPDDQSWTEADLKRQYKRSALLYHPDKNRSPGATEQFQRIQESYEYLMKHQGLFHEPEFSSDDNDTTYIQALFSFLKPILESGNFQEIKSKIIHTLVNYITEKCEPKALTLLQKLDKRVFCTIRDLLHAHKEVFYFSNTFLDKIDEIYNMKVDDQRIILHPSIDDLFSNNLYKLVEPGGTFLVPLWHHELVYDNSGIDLYVECVPILDDNIDIDENNDIHVSISCSLDKLWSMESIDFHLGQQPFSIVRKDLLMVETQTVVIKNMGISRINTRSIYHISNRGDIFLHLQII
jgi:hypothetical protein